MRDRDSDDPRDDGPESGNDVSPLIIALVGLVVGVVVVLSVIGIFVSRDPQPTGGGAGAVCTQTCWGFLKLECPTNRIMGACFGWPSCGGTPHRCGTDP
jgi:hypothetical protein